MFRLVLVLATLAGLVTPAAAQRRYPIADFERIVVEGPYDVRLTVGRATNAAATGDPRVLDSVSVEVQGTTLRIRRNRNAWTAAPSSGATPVITLTTRNLRAAQVIGAGRLEVAGARGLRVALSVEGGGRLTATGLAADNLSLGLRGSGALIVAGTAKVLTADIQGAGALDGERLTAEAATISATTSGEIRLNATRTATVTANGLGSVTVAGPAACTVRGPGAGAVSCGAERR